MKTIQEISNATIEIMIADGSIQKLIEKGISTAIESAIAAQFKSYGDLTKQIESALKDGLQLDFSEIPFETYNEQMLVAVKLKIGAMFADTATNKFMQEIDKVLAPAPKTLSIVEFVNCIVKTWRTEAECGYEEVDDDATIELTQSDYTSSYTSSYSLSLWKQLNSSTRYSSAANIADIRLYIIDGEIRINHSHEYNPTCFNEAEAYIFKLYAAGTKITGLDEFDSSDCDLQIKQDFQ